MFRLSDRRVGLHGLRALHNTSDVAMSCLCVAAKPMSTKITFFFPFLSGKTNVRNRNRNYVQLTKDVLIRTRAARLERKCFQPRRNRRNSACFSFFFGSINVRLGVHGGFKPHVFEAPIILFLL